MVLRPPFIRIVRLVNAKAGSPGPTAGAVREISTVSERMCSGHVDSSLARNGRMR